MTSDIMHIETDALVVGSGVAGMMAVVGCMRSGVKPVIATKGTYASGASSMARGGHSLALGHSDAEDNPELFFEDIFAGSGDIGNPRLIDIVAHESIARSAELDDWGLGLVKQDDGKYDQRFGGFPHRYSRMVHCVRLMGKPLMAALSGKTKSWIDPITHLHFVDLLMDGDKVIGAWGFLHQKGTPVVVHAKSTILSTGGAPQLHALNDSPPVVSGDGYAMAYRAGAELIDMEFIDYQILTAAPPKMAGYPPFSTGLLGGGGYLINGEGERFMHKYEPEKQERTTRAVINRAMAIEIMEGRGTKDGNIHIDIRHVFDELNEGPGKSIIETMKKNGVDMSKEYLEVNSGPHTYLGGIRIDEWGRTNVEGLYAGGEAAGGIHGANRLGGLALIDSYVFGFRSGITAALESKERAAPSADAGGWTDTLAELEADPKSNKSGPTADEWRLEVQTLVAGSIGQVRREDILVDALAKLDELEEKGKDAQVDTGSARKQAESLRRNSETQNLIETGRMLATAALNRRESRGGHYRMDYPEQDDKNFKGNFVIWEENGACKAELRPVPSRDDIAPPPPGEISLEYDPMTEDAA